MENEYVISVGYSQSNGGANGQITTAEVLGDPNVVALALDTFAPGCRLKQQDASTGYDLVIWNNDAALGAIPSWSEVIRNDTAGVSVATVSLTSAQIKALNGTPIELVPAPGSGKAIEVISVMGKLAFLTAAYATHTELDVVDTTSGDVLFKDTGTLLAATGNITAQIPANTNSNAGLEVTPNGSVSVTVPAGNPATGAGTLKMYVTYKTVTL